MDSTGARAARSSVEDRYRVLLDIGRTLAGTLGSDELYEAIYRETASVLEASGFFISVYDAAVDEACIVFLAEPEGVRRDARLTYAGSESAVIRTRKPILVSDRSEPDQGDFPGDPRARPARSAVSAPMMHKGDLLGAISAQSYEADAYTPEDLDLLQGIADIAGVAIHNAMIVEELAARRREAEQVEEIGRALAASLDAQEVLRRVVAAVTSVLASDGATVWLCDPPDCAVGRIADSAGEIALDPGLEWELTGILAEALIESRQPIILDDLEASGVVPEALRDIISAGSAIAVPLVVGGRVVGVLSAGSRKLRNFGRDDVNVLLRLGHQASISLENARLHADLQALSLTDPLTGLPNRRRLQIHLDKEVAAARRGRSLVMVVFDLDDFKRYNDELGHLVGDRILRAFAQVLSDENRAMNLVARYGGDEFVTVLSESHMDGARLYVERVGERLDSDPALSEHGVSVSTGLAEFDRASMATADDLMAAADADMYGAKARRAGDERVRPLGGGHASGRPRERRAGS